MSNSYTPIIIPITSEKEPEKCPSCKKIEDIKTVCRNCGYEYTDNDDPSSFLVFMFFIFVVWVVGTIYAWIFTNKPYPAEYGDHQTLVGVLQFQWNWLYEHMISKMAFKIV